MTASHSSLHDLQTRLGAEWMPYGPPASEGGVEIVATFDAYEAEYAAIRRHVGLLHLPQRGLLRLTGSADDRKDFLHRMVTHDVNGLADGGIRRALQLNQKGRIVADLTLLHGQDDTWAELDRYDLPDVQRLWEDRLFAEDVQIEDFSSRRETLAVIGPAAEALLESLRDEGTAVREINVATHHVLRLGGTVVTAYRWDDAGSPGFRLLVPTEAVGGLYQTLLDAAGFESEADLDPAFAERRRQGLRGRPIGWLAYNTARIEAGTPMFHIDFGNDSLPGETGLLDETVSFTKGCYLGQEIVARMKNLGHPKRMLVGVRFAGEDLPVAGAQVLDPADRVTPIGAVTSSTLSPLLGSIAIGFAVMKWGRHEPGGKILAPAEGRLIEGEVTGLRFL